VWERRRDIGDIFPRVFIVHKYTTIIVENNKNNVFLVINAVTIFNTWFMEIIVFNYYYV